jgi:hypothetical protein
MAERGPIRYRDGNQGEYLADFAPVEKKFYPYRDAVAILDEWFRAHSDEMNLRDRLTISGLSPALKTAKRDELSRKLASREPGSGRLDSSNRRGARRADA